MKNWGRSWRCLQTWAPCDRQKLPLLHTRAFASCCALALLSATVTCLSRGVLKAQPLPLGMTLYSGERSFEHPACDSSSCPKMHPKAEAERG